MIERIRKSMKERDEGFTLVELLVVMIIIGILAAIAIPQYIGQRQRGYDTSVQSDLKNLSTGAETYFAANLAYPTTAAGFATNGTAAQVSKDNTFQAFVQATGANSGFIIVGKNANSDQFFLVSSYNGGAPTRITAADFTAAKALLTAGAFGTGQPAFTAATAIAIS